MGKRPNILWPGVWGLAALISFFGGSCENQRGVAADARDPVGDDSKSVDAAHHGHDPEYHLESVPRAVVEFEDTLGEMAAFPIFDVSEAISDSRNWHRSTHWSMTFRPPPDEANDRYHYLSIDLPARESYEQFEGRYDFTADGAITSPTIAYMPGEGSPYLVRPEQKNPGYARIENMQGTEMTIRIEAELLNVEDHSDRVRIDETFTTSWHVVCSYDKNGDGETWLGDPKFESEFCQQFQDAPWPHAHVR